MISKIIQYRGFNNYPESQSCTKPCREIKAISTLKRSVKAEFWDDNKINLNFKKTVKVTRYQKAYGVFELVVDVGSSLGLWIGLSVLGVFDLIFQAGIKINQILGKRMLKPGDFHAHPPTVTGKYSIYKSIFYLK